MNFKHTLENETLRNKLRTIVLNSPFRKWYLRERIGIEPYNGTSSVDIEWKTQVGMFPNGDCVHEIQVKHPNAQDLEGLTIALISDLHLGERHTSLLRKIFPFIRKPDDTVPDFIDQYRAYFERTKGKIDVVLVGGDLSKEGKISNIKEHKHFFEELVDVPNLSDVNGRPATYFICGNHDYFNCRWIRLAEELESYGLTYLDNISTKLNYQKNPIHIVGLRDLYFYKTQQPKEHKNRINWWQSIYDASSQDYNDAIPDENNVLVMAHNLDGFNGKITKNPLAIFSGHTHAGEFNFLGINAIFKLMFTDAYHNINNHIRGAKQLGDTFSYVSPGSVSRLKTDYGISRFGFPKKVPKPGMSVIKFVNEFEERV